MARIIIKPAAINFKQGETLRLAPVDGRKERMDIRIAEIDSDFVHVQEHLHVVVAAARAKFRDIAL